MSRKEQTEAFDKQVYQDILDYLATATFQIFNLRVITYEWRGSCYTVKKNCSPDFVYRSMMRLQKQALIKNVGHNAWMLVNKEK